MVRGLVMGPGTDYAVTHFNPWARLVRAEYTGSNPYEDGNWSGPEFLESAQIPLTVHPIGNSPAGWWALHAQLLTALRPIATDAIEPEIHWRNGGQDFMMFARPRAVSPEVRNMSTGDVTTTCSLLALDPSIYSGGEDGVHEVEVGLYRTVGGMSVPFGLPMAIHTTVIDGVTTVHNAGSTPTPLNIRITGPVANPIILAESDAAGAATLTINVVLGLDDWIDINTGDLTVIQNGTASRLGAAQGTFPMAHPGDTTIQYVSTNYNDLTKARIQWRDRW